MYVIPAGNALLDNGSVLSAKQNIVITIVYSCANYFIVVSAKGSHKYLL